MNLLITDSPDHNSDTLRLFKSLGIIFPVHLVSILAKECQVITLSKHDGFIQRSNVADGNDNVIKTIGLMSKTTTLHAHHTILYIHSFPFLYDYDVKMPNFAFNVACARLSDSIVGTY